MSETTIAPEAGWKYDTHVDKDPVDTGGWVYDKSTGFSLRDMFAIEAMGCLLEPGDSVSQYGQLAEMAYSMADAMIAERAKTHVPYRHFDTGPR